MSQQSNNNPTNKQPVGRNTIIGKNQLAIVIANEKEIASQLFNYDDIREIRVSVNDLEVRLLMNYDESYHRVFKVIPRNNTPEERKQAEIQVLKFYNDLMNASMKFTKEELENIKTQRDALIKEYQEKVKTGSNNNNTNN